MNTIKPPAHTRVPNDLKQALDAHAQAGTLWKDITPLAKGEWICWITSAKKDETRAKRIAVAMDKLTKGDRRPCCWPGCPHR